MSLNFPRITDCPDSLSTETYSRTCHLDYLVHWPRNRASQDKIQITEEAPATQLVAMTEDSGELAPRRDEYFDLGSIFRNSATITFVVQIGAVILMVGSLTAYGIGDLFLSLAPDLQILLLLIISILFLVIFLAAISAFIRFSRRIGNAVVGPGIERVPFNTPRVKTVVIMYGLLVALMAITGLYIWYLVDQNFLIPFTAGSTSLRLFGFALGGFVIALLIQIIVAGVGRSASRIIIEVLDADDDDEFLR